MGVRLYPNTTDTAALEALAGVPHGTAAKLAAIEAKHAAPETADFKAHRDAADALYEELYADGNEDVNTYHGFLTFGFGKFDHLPGVTEGYAGRLDDLHQSQRLLRWNEIPADAQLCAGLHWC